MCISLPKCRIIVFISSNPMSVLWDTKMPFVRAYVGMRIEISSHVITKSVPALVETRKTTKYGHTRSTTLQLMLNLSPMGSQMHFIWAYVGMCLEIVVISYHHDHCQFCLTQKSLYGHTKFMCHE